MRYSVPTTAPWAWYWKFNLLPAVQAAYPNLVDLIDE